MTTDGPMAKTRTKGKSVVSCRLGIIDHQNNRTNTGHDGSRGGRSTEEEFNPKEFSSPTEHDDRTPPAATSAGPLKTSNKSPLPKFCIFKITKWIIRWRSVRDRRRVFKQQQMGFSTFDAKVLDFDNVQRMFSKRTGSLGSPPEKSATFKPTLCVFWGMGICS